MAIKQPDNRATSLIYILGMAAFFSRFTKTFWQCPNEHRVIRLHDSPES